MKIKLPTSQQEIERRLQSVHSSFWYRKTLYPLIAGKLQGQEMGPLELLQRFDESIQIAMPQKDIAALLRYWILQWLDALIDDKNQAVDAIMLFHEKRANKEIEVTKI